MYFYGFKITSKFKNLKCVHLARLDLKNYDDGFFWKIKIDINRVVLAVLELMEYPSFSKIFYHTPSYYILINNILTFPGTQIFLYTFASSFYFFPNSSTDGS